MIRRVLHRETSSSSSTTTRERQAWETRRWGIGVLHYVFRPFLFSLALTHHQTPRVAWTWDISLLVCLLASPPFSSLLSPGLRMGISSARHSTIAGGRERRRAFQVLWWRGCADGKACDLHSWNESP